MASQSTCIAERKVHIVASLYVD